MWELDPAARPLWSGRGGVLVLPASFRQKLHNSRTLTQQSCNRTEKERCT